MSIMQTLSKWFSHDLGIDLGTANTLVFVQGYGIVLQEPSVVAVHAKTGKVMAVGVEAKKMIGRVSMNIKAIRPMKEGVIADFDVTEEMMRYFIQKAQRRGKLLRPRVLVAVPSGITEVEERAVKDSALKAGARAVEVLPQPMAAALGVGLPVSKPTGSMIVDIGGGTTQVAVISLSDIVESVCLRVGGDALDDAIIRMVRREFNLTIGERTAEQIKIDLGSAVPMEKELAMEVRGRDLNSGLPKAITVTSQQVREAMSDPLMKIVDACKQTLEKCPPELASDLIDHGIVMSGGSALLRSIDLLIQEHTRLRVAIAKDPLLAVATGTGLALETLDLMNGK